MMPGKQKVKAKSSAAEEKEPMRINGLTREEITREQLEEHIAYLRAEVCKEEMKRDQYILETEQIQAFMDRDKKELQRLEAEEKKMLEEMEENKRRHQENIKGYQQDIKRLLLEHEKTMAELKAGALHSTEVLQKEQEDLDNKLHKEVRATEAEAEELPELQNEDIVKELQQAHEEAMAKARDRWEKYTAELKATYQKKEELLSQKVAKIREEYFRGREDQRDSHSLAIAAGPTSAVTEARALIDMMKQDMEKFESLKDQHAKLQKQEKKKRRELRSILDENKRLAERLENAKKELASIEERTKFYQAKMVVDNTKKKELNKMKREYQALQEKFSKLQLEKDECEKNFIPNIQRAQQRAAERKMALQRKLNGLIVSVEETRAQLDSLLPNVPADQTALNDLLKKATELLKSKNNEIKTLRSQSAQLSQAHENLLFAVQTRKRRLGLPTEQL